LPTPTTRDFKDGQAEHERNGIVQTDTVARAIFNSGEVDLIGTPRANAANSSAKQVEADAPKARIEDQVLTTNWGKFEPAIRRWEQILGRVAPAPTKPDGKEGAHRLSSKFTEWMMGLPDGWITGHGLSRNDELKMAGNGVVPQQAELALRILLEGVELTLRKEQTKLPTPTTQDNRPGDVMRGVAVENLANGKNRGLGLNHLVEAVGVDWQEGDTFIMTPDGLQNNRKGVTL
jgi:hypothetical protein